MSASDSVAPGELLAVVVALRNVMTAVDSAAFITSGNLEEIDVDAEDLAKTLRPQLQDVSNGIFELLARLEELPEYRRLRQRLLRERRGDNIS